MNRRRPLAVFTAALLLCLTLAACGKGTSLSSSPTGEPVSRTSGEETTGTTESTTRTEDGTSATGGTTTAESTATATTTTGTTKTPTTKSPTTKVPTTKAPTTKATTTKSTTKKPTTGVTVPQVGNGQVTAQMLSVVEAEFLRLVNQERTSLGKKALTVNTSLDAGAQIRAEEITTLFSHTRPDGTECYTAISHEHEHFRALGENIAYTGFAENGYISSADVFTGSEAQLKQAAANAFRQFKESPGHYTNMISDDFEQTGIGVLSKPEPALGVPVFYVAHFFGTPWDM